MIAVQKLLMIMEQCFGFLILIQAEFALADGGDSPMNRLRSLISSTWCLGKADLANRQGRLMPRALDI